MGHAGSVDAERDAHLAHHYLPPGVGRKPSVGVEHFKFALVAKVGLEEIADRLRYLSAYAYAGIAHLEALHFRVGLVFESSAECAVYFGYEA